MQNKQHSDAAMPEVKRSFGISPLWILPVVTLILASWLVFQAVHHAGDQIKIYFSDAQGLEAGRTTIRYQGLEVGMVREVSLDKENDNIFVLADIYPEAQYLLSENTRFWLVKPTASLSGISGLDALVSGNYIAIHPGAQSTTIPKQFQGQITAPTDIKQSQGLNITLKAEALDGIQIGSKVLYKKIPIGEVYHYELTPDNKSLLLHVVIDKPFEKIINSKSRFWNVSGLSANVDFRGLNVEVDSLASLIVGAIAVDSPDAAKPVKDNTQFKLYTNLKSAGRGILVEVELPEHHGISANNTPIMYRGISVGEITDIHFSDDRNKIIANAAIQADFSDLLNDGTKFVLVEPEFSFAGIKNLDNVFKGNFLSLRAGEGKSTRHFIAQRQKVVDQTSQRFVHITLNADNAYGLKVGSKIKYRGLPVGEIADISLDGEKVIFSINIRSKFKTLLRSKNRFYVTGVAQVDVNENGLKVDMPPIEDIFLDSISFFSEGQNSARTSYHLYANKSAANLAVEDSKGTSRLTLITDKLPGFKVGAPLLYRNVKVGQVDNFQLEGRNVIVSVVIENTYRHLMNDNTVFWSQSGIKIDASLAGIDITAAPLSSVINGGVSFETLPDVANKSQDMWILYDNYDVASKQGHSVTLYGKDSYGLTKNASVEYLGTQVGKLTNVRPDIKNERVAFTLQLFPEYSKTLATLNSYFWVSSSESALKQLQNVKQLIQPSIHVMPGKGIESQSTTLHTAGPVSSNGLTIHLQSNAKRSITAGSAVTFRDIKVGQVTSVKLGDLADRVVTTLVIEPQFAYLVRKDSVFWDHSGIDVSIGLGGADIKTGSLESMLTGGIAFNTPEQSSTSPQADASDTFILHAKAEDEWLDWNQPLLKPR